jgi:hypothetical protein
VTLFGPVVDYLVTKAGTAIAGLPDEWAVSDGEAREVGNFMFVVGVNEPPADGGTAQVTAARSYVSLGAQKIEQDLTFPCYIDARVSEVDATSQKAARDKAESAFNAFWPLLKADLTFGGLLAVDAAIPTVTGEPRPVGTAAEPGRRFLIKFDVLGRTRTA